MTRKEVAFAACIMVTTLCLIVSNITSSKLYEMTFLSLNVIVPVGTPLFCLSFLATDIVSEIWGRQYAILVAVLGLIARVCVAGFFFFAISIDGIDSWSNQEAYATILGASSRMLIAGVIAYLVASIIDAYVFHYFREKHKDRNLLFLRNNISTFTAHLIGAILFVTISFYGTVSNDILFKILLGNMGIKWIVAMVDTPLVYIFRNIILERKLFDFKG